MIEEGFVQSGHACFGCHYPALRPANCPHCHQSTEPCADIVDEAVELARHRHCQVRHLEGAARLRDAGRIGARLRFQAA